MPRVIAGCGASLTCGEGPTACVYCDRVSTPLLADLLARGKAGGYSADIKMIYSAGGDLLRRAGAPGVSHRAVTLKAARASVRSPRQRANADHASYGMEGGRGNFQQGTSFIGCRLFSPSLAGSDLAMQLGTCAARSAPFCIYCVCV